jgi:polyhydroxybutyrate depolymerase
MNWLRNFIVLLLLSLGFTTLAGAADGFLPGGFQRLAFTVDGVAREALVYVPTAAQTASVPMVFVFHGHGGTARQAIRSFSLNQYWPEAISVYMQGLNTPGQITDPQGKKSGWQAAIGDQGDRDLKFFDAVLARLKQDYRVDTNRIYATGHSNGGGFTYLLWAARGEVFAAVAPSSAVATYVNRLLPKPAMHFAGENDPLVKFSWQKAMMAAVRRVNGCEAEGKVWDKQCTLYPSKKGTPLVTCIHPGGHEFDSNAPRLMVKFFQEHPAAGK